MSVVICYFSALKTLLFWLLFTLITGCIAEDKKTTNPTNSDGNTVNNTTLALNGFWNGGFDQTETLRVLIYNGDVYGLDADKAFFGTVESPMEEEVDFVVTAYPFSYEDTTNFEFVADGAATVYTINGLLATTTSLVGDFATDITTFGSLSLVNDATFSNNSSLTALVGKWTTSDLELNITSRGRFHGVNNGAGKDCSYEGEITLLNASDSLLAITLNRRNCDDFNGDSTGFVALNAEGELELYSKMGNALLFIKFSAPTSGSSTATEGETTTETTEGATTTDPAVEEAAAVENIEI